MLIIDPISKMNNPNEQEIWHDSFEESFFVYVANAVHEHGGSNQLKFKKMEQLLEYKNNPPYSSKLKEAYWVIPFFYIKKEYQIDFSKVQQIKDEKFLQHLSIFLRQKQLNYRTFWGIM